MLSNNVNTASFVPLQVRALDENGQPVENTTVDFSASDSNISFSQASCQTNRVGVCSVNVNTQAAGSYDVDVKIDNEEVRNSPANITFNTESSVTVINNGAFANNIDAITLRAHIVDSSNAPVASEVVTFDNSNINAPANGEINFSALTCTTDTSGICEVNVRSLNLGFNYNVGVSTSNGAVGSGPVGFYFSRIGKTDGLFTSMTPRIVNNTSGSDDGILIYVVVSDAFNQLVDYEEVSFQGNSSDVTLSNTRCFTKGASGCSIKLTSNQAGSYNITASIADDALNGGQPIQVEFFAPVTNATPSQGFNDTGITIGGNFPSGNNATCIGESVAYQDCSHGRDNTSNNGSNGLGGFDFTKLDANGNALAANASSWSCVRDNVTGLIWEVKTTDGGLRDRNHLYTSYDSRFSDGDSTTDSSNVGTDKIWAGPVDTGINSGEDNCGDNNRVCTTEQYVTNVNNATLCGASDWRMPTVNELQDMANLGQRGTSLDRGYFPNQISTTTNSFVWSSTPRYINNSNREVLGFRYYTGFIAQDSRNDSGAVRLVRKAQAVR
ncbi:Ig-like domain-containing protein [Bacterioplanoides sp. SCSIO 12839]|uniref:Ig-like domain-containing protein n=1 Tax=Bacterioplanoides sp. SCSIO 12839 TaxID=2829569 RepID=UPI00210639C5|nr:Ig-like domain-containing protein [Bacterioplanoides sp. SCSIO 12839]UTW47635.1 Ig-like domain-containing protein [Bacterioplanoides sp. SCSIO 12839]